MKRRDLLKVALGGLSAVVTLPLVGVVKGEAAEVSAKPLKSSSGFAMVQCPSPTSPPVKICSIPLVKDYPRWLTHPFIGGSVCALGGDTIHLTIGSQSFKRSWDIHTSLTALGCTSKGLLIVWDQEKGVCRTAKQSVEVTEVPNDRRHSFEPKPLKNNYVEPWGLIGSGKISYKD